MGLSKLQLFTEVPPFSAIGIQCQVSSFLDSSFLSLLVLICFHPFASLQVKMNSIQMDAVELGRIEAKQNNDDKDMARLGKHPVLKVCLPIHFCI